MNDITDIKQLESNLPAMSIPSIARRIAIDWTKVNYAAKPYLSAMRNDDAGLDGMKSVVLYFLSNASTWRGAVAKLVKAELKRRYK